MAISAGAPLLDLFPTFAAAEEGDGAREEETGCIGNPSQLLVRDLVIGFLPAALSPDSPAAGKGPPLISLPLARRERGGMTVFIMGGKSDRVWLLPLTMLVLLLLTPPSARDTTAGLGPIPAPPSQLICLDDDDGMAPAPPPPPPLPREVFIKAAPPIMEVEEGRGGLDTAAAAGEKLVPWIVMLSGVGFQGSAAC